MRSLSIGIFALGLFAAGFGERRDDCCEHMATRMGNMHGTMGHGMSCRQMASRLDIRVEQVPGGSVIHVLSKDPAMVDQARNMAQMMSSCLSR